MKVINGRLDLPFPTKAYREVVRVATETDATYIEYVPGYFVVHHDKQPPPPKGAIVFRPGCDEGEIVQ